MEYLHQIPPIRDQKIPWKRKQKSLREERTPEQDSLSQLRKAYMNSDMEAASMKPTQVGKRSSTYKLQLSARYFYGVLDHMNEWVSHSHGFYVFFFFLFWVDLSSLDVMIFVLSCYTFFCHVSLLALINLLFSNEKQKGSRSGGRGVREELGAIEDSETIIRIYDYYMRKEKKHNNFIPFTNVY